MSEDSLTYYNVFLSSEDEPKAEATHEIVLELKDRLFVEGPIRNLLLNEGYELGLNKPPKSFLEIGGSIWNREKTKVHILYLNEAILQTALSDKQIKKRRDWKVDQKRELRSIQKEFQIGYPLYSAVSDYYNNLQSALGEYNLQIVLGRMNEASNIFLSDWESPEHKLQERIIGIALRNPEIYGGLDSAYYNQGNRYFAKAGDAWKTLHNIRYGDFFILNNKEVSDGLRSLRTGVERL